MFWWKRRLRAADGTGHRDGPAMPGPVSRTGNADATAGSIANTGHLHIDTAFSGTAHNVVQADIVNHFTIAAAPAAPPPIPHQLPPRIADFHGRADALSRLNAEVERCLPVGDPAVVIMSGMGGVGKTSLAVHWLHTIADRFPDGQLYANLRGFSDGPTATASQVLEQFLRALDVPAERIPADEDSRAGLFRSVTHGRSFLLLLDNALDARQVRPLIPSVGASLTVITSRSRLTGLAVQLGAARIGLEPFDSHAAIQMLIDNRQGLPEADLLLADSIARKCGYLPLTLRIILERLAAHPGSFGACAAQIIEELQDAHAALDTFSPLDGDSSTELRLVLSWSYADLPHDLARTLRLLGLHPGADFSAADLAALAAVEQTEAVRRMDRLVELSLLEPSDRSRFRFHDLLRAFASERAQQDEPGAEARQARRRLMTRYLSRIDAADRLLAPGRRHVLPAEEAGEPFTSYEEALAWCDVERLNCLAMVRAAAANGEDELCWRIAMALITPLVLGSYQADRHEVCEIGLQAARRAGDRWGEAWSLMSLGGALHELGLNDEAAAKDREAATLWRALGDAEGEGKSLNNLGNTLIAQGRLAEAAQVMEDALRIRRSLGKQREIAISLYLLGDLHAAQGNLEAAEQNYRESLALRASADRQTIGFALSGLAGVALLRGDLHSAQAAFGESADAHGDSGYLHGQAIALRSRARCLRDLGRTADAHATMATALALLQTAGDPAAGEVQRELQEFGRSSG